MKIALQTWGSNGDIRPFMALASGLKQAGHEVTLVVSSLDNRSYLETCKTLCIEYLQIPQHIDFDMQDFAQRTFRMNTLQWLIELLNISLFPYEDEIYQASKTLAETHDILIGHHFLYPLKIAALKYNKPYITVTFCHAAIPTKTTAPFRFPNLGKFLNRFQWRILNELFDWVLKKRLSRLWFQENLPPFKHVFETMLTSDSLNLVAVDEFLCANRDEWQPVNQLCGFLNLPESAEDWQPSPALQAFLQAGDKPVYMTFGSIQQAVPDWSMELFIEAARLSGCRAIIQTSSVKYPVETQQGDCFFIGRHPHQPLFKQCAAVVHHGGAGTTHASTLSGCPSIVIPFMDEQLFWACQLEKAGVAPKPLPARKATAEALAERIKTVLNTPSMTEKAQHAKHCISPTQGVLNAVAMIENVFK
ncbi:vancomycin aglycone glucosyltransferase [Patescibacteria group bacterium]|nr:vancomycin aglycone glucosyltransferase [Patescibacteria group bacterium]